MNEMGQRVPGQEEPRRRAIHALSGALAAIVVIAAALGVTAVISSPNHASGQVAPPFVGDPSVPCETPPIAWVDSTPVGKPFRNGHLIGGVQLAAEGDDFFTWSFGVAPSPGWRRFGVDGTIRMLLRVLCDFHTAHPAAPRIGVGDIARPVGGEFGKRFGGEGHASHQNGLDVDVLYPRIDHRELVAVRPTLIDHALAQDLVNRFVAIGAKYVFVGPRTELTGPRKIVQELYHHDDHLHVRFPRGLATGTPPPAPGSPVP